MVQYWKATLDTDELTSHEQTQDHINKYHAVILNEGFRASNQSSLQWNANITMLLENKS